MTDEAVGGVQRLVREQAWQSANREPERGRDDPVVETLREAFDCRCGDAGRRELRRIASDDLRYRCARRTQIIAREWAHDVAHVRVETALSQARGRDQQHDEHSERQLLRACLDGVTHYTCTACDDNNRDDAERSARCIAARWIVPTTFERIDESADPHDRMSDARIQGVRIADARLDREHCGRQPEFSSHAGRGSRSAAGRARAAAIAPRSHTPRAASTG